MGKLHFTTLNYHHFFNSPLNFKNAQLTPNYIQLYGRYPYDQNQVIIDKIVYHVTHTWSRIHQTTLYQFNFSENLEMPFTPT